MPKLPATPPPVVGTPGVLLKPPAYPPPGRAADPAQYLKSEDLPGVRVWRVGGDFAPREIRVEDAAVIPAGGRLGIKFLTPSGSRLRGTLRLRNLAKFQLTLSSTAKRSVVLGHRICRASSLTSSAARLICDVFCRAFVSRDCRWHTSSLRRIAPEPGERPRWRRTCCIP